MLFPPIYLFMDLQLDKDFDVAMDEVYFYYRVRSRAFTPKDPWLYLVYINMYTRLRNMWNMFMEIYMYVTTNHILYYLYITILLYICIYLYIYCYIYTYIYIYIYIYNIYIYIHPYIYISICLYCIYIRIYLFFILFLQLPALVEINRVFCIYKVLLQEKPGIS